MSVLVFSDGTVLWAPSVTLRGVCRLNLIQWPYDEQSCTLVMGSRSEAGHVNVALLHNSSSVAIVSPSGQISSQWTVKQTQAFVTQFRLDTLMGDSYPVAGFAFHVQRNSASFLPVIVIPGLGNKRAVSHRVTHRGTHRVTHRGTHRVTRRREISSVDSQSRKNQGLISSSLFFNQGQE